MVFFVTNVSGKEPCVIKPHWESVKMCDFMGVLLLQF